MGLAMRLTMGQRRTALSELLLVTDEAGVLRALDFADCEERLRRLLRRDYGSPVLQEGVVPAAISDAIDRYFAGQLGALEAVPVATGGTAFQREVWRALRRIAAGETWSYGELAARVGRPGASRAVGAANGANPIPLVLPCHRVIGATGALTGYGGGMARKRWLLAHEERFAGGARSATGGGQETMESQPLLASSVV